MPREPDIGATMSSDAAVIPSGAAQRRRRGIAGPCHSERSALGAEARNRNRPSRGSGLPVGTMAIPRLRRCAAPLGMTCAAAVIRWLIGRTGNWISRDTRNRRIARAGRGCPRRQSVRAARHRGDTGEPHCRSRGRRDRPRAGSRNADEARRQATAGARGSRIRGLRRRVRRDAGLHQSRERKPGKKLTPAQAAALIETATGIRTLIGC